MYIYIDRLSYEYIYIYIYIYTQIYLSLNQKGARRWQPSWHTLMKRFITSPENARDEKVRARLFEYDPATVLGAVSPFSNTVSPPCLMMKRRPSR